MANVDQVCRRPVSYNLDLPPFQNNVGVVPGIDTLRSSQQIKIEIDKNRQQSRDFIHW